MSLTTATRAAVVAPIRAYQRWISPLTPPSCRFEPSCSHYAVGAVRTHGVLRGLPMAAWRILRCHPWSRGGYDPVPVARHAGDHRRRPSSGPPAS